MLIVGRDHDLLHVLVLTITKLMVLVFCVQHKNRG